MSINFSPRYLVVGIYKDRDRPIVRFYLPFVRVSIGSKKTLAERLTGGWLG